MTFSYIHKTGLLRPAKSLNLATSIDINMNYSLVFLKYISSAKSEDKRQYL